MESSLNPPEIVKFVPFSSCINPSFWYELNRVKLDEYKLNDDFKEIIGSFNNCLLLFSQSNFLVENIY
jgi:hypothetical protein